jgi:single-strand DNA-binding protein
MMNKVMLIGYIGRDAEIKHTDNGSTVANFSIATSEKWKDRQGQDQERTEWHKVVLWGKVVEAVGQYLVKGKQVYVEGSIQSRKWQDRDGNDRTTVEVKAHQVRLLGGGGGAVVERQEVVGRGNPSHQDSELSLADVPF